MYISKSQIITKEIYNEKNIKLSRFTLHFTDLGFENKSIHTEIKNFNDHLIKIYKLSRESAREEDDDKIIYEINYPSIGLRKFDTIFSKHKTFFKIMKLENKIKQLQEDTNHLINSEQALKIIKYMGKIEKYKKREENLVKEYKKHENSKRVINDAFVTFYSPYIAKVIKNAYKLNKLNRSIKILCGNQDKLQNL